MLMMVQGHTFDALLKDDYRTSESVIYSVWHFMRGFTAPIFMFTSGVVFTFLMKKNGKPFAENGRVVKGIKRAVSLIVIGYLLRYPTHKVIIFDNVSYEQWRSFFVVDALHLIGVSLGIIILVSYIAERFRIKSSMLFGLGMLFMFVLAPVMWKTDWLNYLPIVFVGYLSPAEGSFFPMFPFAGYVLGGAFLGNILATEEGIYLKSKFQTGLIRTGIVLILAHWGLVFVNNSADTAIISGSIEQITFSFFRLGSVILLTGMVAFAAARVRKIPDVLRVLGKHTLVIYVVHLVMLYGSAWIPGISMFYSRSFGMGETLIAVVIMLSLMTALAYSMERANLNMLKIRRANAIKKYRIEVGR